MIAAILSQQEYEHLLKLEEMAKFIHRRAADLVSDIDRIRRMVTIDSDVDLALSELQDRIHVWQSRE